MMEQTIGAKLLALKERSGLSLTKIAKAAGYRSASSIQRYFSQDYDVEHLPKGIADRMMKGLIGFGEPPIQHSDLDQLTELGFLTERRLPAAFSMTRAKRQYIECQPTFSYGQWRGEAEEFGVGDDAILYFRTPDHLVYRSIAAFYVCTTSLAPRFLVGEIAFYERERPPAIGQDVIVFIKAESDFRPSAILARLAAVNRTSFALEIFGSDTDLTINREQVEEILPLLRADDLVSQISRSEAYAVG